VKLDDPDVFLWAERWSDAEHLLDHLASEEYRALVGAARVLGKLQEQRIVAFDPWPRKATPE
jgi:quinol monooxygenase YgiN